MRSLLLLFACASLHADDWPQWLGPNRDSVWRESGIIGTFPDGGPKVLWRVKIGGGYTGPAVANGKVYLMDRQVAVNTRAPGNAFSRGLIAGTERVLCLEEKTGALQWEHRYDCTYTMSYSTGPRCTPLVSDGKVWTVGAEGNLFCLDAENGKVLWSHDYKADYGARTPMWGFAGHPLLDGQRLICLVGGPGCVAMAFDKDSGKELWRSLDAREPGYCPPTMIEHGGTKQLILWHPQSVNSLDPATGKIFWSCPWDVRAGLTVATPRLSGDLLLFSSFYTSSKCFKLNTTKPTAELQWEGKSFSEKNTDTLHSLISTPFIEDGHIYGVCSYGQLRCLKLDTGERVWETFAATTGDKPVRWANAFIIKHEGRFFLANEQGDLIIARLSPKGYEEISRASILKPTTTDPRRAVVWSHPAFANQCVFMRNDEEIVCASLAK
ncbi:PQQ-binding-like beta-propeller repeat protein [Prosthecobacter sp.]|uniref:PQQ-binding-like beta-propeller repeat protein n=1 Tax=Prosthecobacter sp. TaxID=1965333 RepID=UPI001DDBF8B6|nr:PQQ-binding-like beta-propeller repeat protein [Prosthecobacter sp.]MCB1278526.1 PQQ-like beta-propeller repeat protein [Prosthecobacter sp.]